MQSRSSSSTREAVLAPFVAFFAALCWLLAGPYSNFSAPGFIDPWVYTGYFTNFSYLIHQYGVTYYASRLPWILPGWLAFQLFPPAAASVLLNALLVASCTTALYWIVRWNYGWQPAIVTCVALLTNLYFITTIAWDYPDGPAIAYLFAAVAFSFRPSGRRALNSVFAAVFLALAGFTNMAAAPVIVAALLIPAWRFRASRRELVREGCYIVAAVCATTFVLCLVSRAVLGYYLFFLPQIRQTTYAFITNPDYLKNMWGTGNAFLATAYRLFPTLFLLIAGGLLLRSKRAAQPFAVAAYLFLLASAILFALQEFVLHGVALRVFYHSSYILTPLFCMAGVVCGEFWIGSRRTIAWIVAMAVSLPWLRAALSQPAFPPPVVWGTVALIGIAAIWPIVRNPARRSMAIPVLLLLILFGGTAFDRALSYPLSRENAPVFDRLMEIQQLMKGAVAENRHVRFWYDYEEPASATYNAAASLYLWGYFDLTRELPAAAPALVREYVASNTTFVHLTLNPEKLAARNRILEARGIRVGNERRWTIQTGSTPIALILEDVTDMSAFR